MLPAIHPNSPTDLAARIGAALMQDANLFGRPSFRSRRAMLGHKDRCFDVAFRPSLVEGYGVSSEGDSTTPMDDEKEAGNVDDYRPYTIATASEDSSARVWRVTQGETKCIRTLGPSHHKAEVLRVAWLENGRPRPRAEKEEGTGSRDAVP